MLVGAPRALDTCAVPAVRAVELDAGAVRFFHRVEAGANAALPKRRLDLRVCPCCLLRPLHNQDRDGLVLVGKLNVWSHGRRFSITDWDSITFAERFRPASFIHSFIQTHNKKQKQPKQQKQKQKPKQNQKKGEET